MIIYRDAAEKYIKNVMFFVNTEIDSDAIFSDEACTIKAEFSEICDAMGNHGIIRMIGNDGFCDGTIVSVAAHKDGSEYVAVTSINGSNGECTIVTIPCAKPDPS